MSAQAVLSISPPTPPSSGLADTVRDGLQRAADVMRAHGLPVPPLEGKLLRPSIAYALVPSAHRHRLDDRFWLGALAIQMVHEASLLHDDILDEAEERRGRKTVFATHGTGAALTKGDHFLTASYRAALWTRSEAFLERFITSVERTVAGEILQGRAVGESLDMATYFDAILGKSGELLRAAASLGPSLLGLERPDERAQLGLELGALYQQVDDLLDYCPSADTGKEGLKDYHQQKWTWVMGLAGLETWDADDAEVLDKVFGSSNGESSVALRAVAYLRSRRENLLAKVSDLVPGDELVAAIVDEWVDAAYSGVERQIAAMRSHPRALQGGAAPLHELSVGASVEATVAAAASRLAGPDEWRRYLLHHAKTFGLASRLFPAEKRNSIEALYAYCRFTDDLVDAQQGRVDPDALQARLEAWRGLSRRAFEQADTGIPLLEAVMGDAAAAGVDWSYPRALLDGIAMDLRPARYSNWQDLGLYTFCVAGAVGGWMAQLFGIRDPDMLARAHALGHAMQLTNILRDVGGDLAMGRVYLPQCLMEEHGITVDDLQAWRTSSGPLPEHYATAMRELMAVAEERYAWALPGIRALPTSFRRPVAVAAAAYQGIHREVRRNGFDNLRRRAHTSLPRKLWLGSFGLLRARPRVVDSTTARILDHSEAQQRPTT